MKSVCYKTKIGSYLNDKRYKVRSCVYFDELKSYYDEVVYFDELEDAFEYYKKEKKSFSVLNCSLFKNGRLIDLYLRDF